MRPPQNQHNPSGRFNRITHRIDTRRLEHETSRLLVVGLVVAIVLHAGLFLLMPHRQPLPPAPIGIPMSFRITPPPNLRPFVVHAPVTRHTQSLRKQFREGQPQEFDSTRPNALDLSYGELPVFDIGDSTGIDLERVFAFIDSFGFMPPELPDAVTDYIRRKRDDEMFLQDGLLRIEDFDTGDNRYQGLVFYNPTDPMSITGIVAIPRLFDRSYPEPVDVSNGVIGLVETIKTLTDIRARVGKPLNLFQNTSFRYPFIYIGTPAYFDYATYDVEAIRNYIESGGFIVLENHYYIDEVTPAEASLKQFMKDAFGSRLRMYPIPNDHALFHCYFHFDDPPPVVPILDEYGNDISIPIDYIEGIFVNGQMIGIYSNKGWGRAWGSLGGSGPLQRIGVNMLVYALRNADIAERYSDPTLARGKNGSYAAEYQMFSQFGKE